jgi:hypothetical protein
MEAANMKRSTVRKPRTVRDVIGEPSSWPNQISDGDHNEIPDMNGATIVDVYSSGRQLAIYTRNSASREALSIFYVDDWDLRARIANVLLPGLAVNDAVSIAID